MMRVQGDSLSKLTILLVEDSPDDAELILRELRRGGITGDFRVVGTVEALADALAVAPWDAVLSDFSLPSADFNAVLSAAKAHDEDLPVIVVSGSIGEEQAVALMREGVSDLVLKPRMSRLAPAIRREITASRRNQARRRSEQRFRDIVEVSGDAIWETDAAHRFTFFSSRFESAEWADPFRSLGRRLWDVLGADTEGDPHWRDHLADLAAHRTFRGFRLSFVSPSRRNHVVSTSGVPVLGKGGELQGYRGTATDETLVVETYWRAEAAERLLRDTTEMGDRAGGSGASR